MKMNVDNSGLIGILSLRGDLTRRTAVRLRNELIKAIEKVDHLVLDMKEVGDIHSSCLQLFCSAHRVAMMSHKKIDIEYPVPQGIIDAIAGREDFKQTNCRLMCENNCLWKECYEDSNAN